MIANTIYDNYDPSKSYKKILFKPSQSLISTELREPLDLKEYPKEIPSISDK